MGLAESVFWVMGSDRRRPKRRASPSWHSQRRRGAPLLMLDTGGHMALIKDIAFTPDGQQLVSASVDKTIRMWDLATDRTASPLRGESAAGDPGTIYAMALSPDGKSLI